MLILEFYISLLPVILAGIATMAWCKLPILRSWDTPLDRHIELKDGERLLGDNKTVKGFVAYIGFGTLFTMLWGLVCDLSPFLLEHNLFYRGYADDVRVNALFGAALGLAWALCELPNSFLKRRLHIAPGKPPKGVTKVFFVLFDQADSIFGCVLVLCLVYPLSVGQYFLLVALGTLTHLVINVLLWLVRLRKEPF